MSNMNNKIKVLNKGITFSTKYDYIANVDSMVVNSIAK